MKFPHLPSDGQAGEANQETFSHFMGPALAWGPVCTHVAMLRGSHRPDALVLLTLFPPKSAPGHQRGGSTYRLETVGRVLDSDPALIATIQGDLAQRPGYSLGLVVNEQLPVPADWAGEKQWGASNAHIGPCTHLFCECDAEGMSAADQLALSELVFGAEPSLSIHTGGKSVHVYFRLREPVSPERFTQLQQLVQLAYEHLSPGCKVDRSLSKPAQVMRIAGGVHPRTGLMASIHTASNTVLEVEALEARLGSLLPPPPAPRHLPSHRPRPGHRRNRYQPTLEDIAYALATYPRRQPGNGNYANHRNLLWGLVKACEEAGGTAEMAIAMMERHSPSRLCGWDVRQVARSGGDQAHPGWFWAQVGGHPAKRRGVRP